MSRRPTIRFALVVMVSACLLGGSVTPAMSAPTSTLATSQTRVERALRRLEAARSRSRAVTAKARTAAAKLDSLIAEQDKIHARLNARSNQMYRTGDTSFLSFLLGASTFREFVTRWDLLVRMNQQDADDLHDIAESRKAAEESAESLLELQAEQARAIAAVNRELAAARRQFAADQSALADYSARAAAAAAAHRTVAKRKAASLQRFKGVGAWKTAVASHYGRNFSGRGASGERIGPYSMIVAHKTLPFGTLIEFEYNGKRAVARVADRGPHIAGRTFDLGPGVVRVLGFEGVHKVRYRIVKR